MFYGQSPQDTRLFFYDTWQKYQQKKILTVIEQQLLDVILAHPEYHAILEDKTQIDKTYLPELGETNPFLHMGLHLGLREQIMTNRPSGILDIYQRLLEKLHDPLVVEHRMMDCLVECMWLAQKNQTIPNDDDYLSLLSSMAEQFI